MKTCVLVLATGAAMMASGCTNSLIAGQVVDQFGSPVAGQSVDLTGDDFTRTATTNAEGKYSVLVPRGFTGVLRYLPSLAMAQVTPGERQYTNVTDSIIDQGFTAVWKMYTISGTVMLMVPGKPAEPFPGVLMLAKGSYRDGVTFDTQATTGSDGVYSLQVPYGWSGTVTPQANDAYQIQVAATP